MPATRPNQNTVKPYHVTQPLESAEKSAFSFARKEDRYNDRLQRKQDSIEKVGGLSSFWIIMSFIGIPLAFTFSIYEANMSQQAISALLDPLGLGNINNNMIALIGAGLAVFAMFIGHIFSEGFNKEINEITGRSKSKIGAPFYFSIVGLLGYIAFQYYLVQAAGEGEFNRFAMVAIGVAILEILVGVLILGKSLTYLLMFFITIQLWLLGKGMAKTSRMTNEMYRDYRAMNTVWNNQNPTMIMELEGSPNIRRALTYYSGIENEETTPPTIEREEERINDDDSERTTADDVEQFINDDDNITM